MSARSYRDEKQFVHPGAGKHPQCPWDEIGKPDLQPMKGLIQQVYLNGPHADNPVLHHLRGSFVEKVVQNPQIVWKGCGYLSPRIVPTFPMRGIRTIYRNSNKAVILVSTAYIRGIYVPYK